MPPVLCPFFSLPCPSPPLIPCVGANGREEKAKKPRRKASPRRQKFFRSHHVLVNTPSGSHTDSRSSEPSLPTYTTRLCALGYATDGNRMALWPPASARSPSNQDGGSMPSANACARHGQSKSCHPEANQEQAQRNHRLQRLRPGPSGRKAEVGRVALSRLESAHHQGRQSADAGRSRQGRSTTTAPKDVAGLLTML